MAVPYHLYVVPRNYRDDILKLLPEGTKEIWAASLPNGEVPSSSIGVVTCYKFNHPLDPKEMGAIARKLGELEVKLIAFQDPRSLPIKKD